MEPGQALEGVAVGETPRQEQAEDGGPQATCRTLNKHPQPSSCR